MLDFMIFATLAISVVGLLAAIALALVAVGSLVSRVLKPNGRG